MQKHLALFICLYAAQVKAAAWHPDDRLLRAVSFVESSHGLFTIGDKGLSLGDYQISEAAWVDVTSWRRAHRLPTYKYERHVWDGTVSREYAADYLSILHAQLEKRLGRPPSAGEIYAAYNMGMTSFAQCRYQLAKVNPTTARKCEQINEMMRQE